MHVILCICFYCTASISSARFGAHTSCKTSGAEWPRVQNEVQPSPQTHHKSKSWAPCERSELTAKCRMLLNLNGLARRKMKRTASGSIQLQQEARTLHLQNVNGCLWARRKQSLAANIVIQKGNIGLGTILYLAFTKLQGLFLWPIHIALKIHPHKFHYIGLAMIYDACMHDWSGCL